MDHRSQLSMDSLFRRRPADSRAASRSASLSRRTAARRRRLVIESLEDRRMLATFSYADQLLTINLDAAASTLTTTAAGSGGYTFSLVGDTFSGSDTFGLVGSGKGRRHRSRRWQPRRPGGGARRRQRRHRRDDREEPPGDAGERQGLRRRRHG